MSDVTHSDPSGPQEIGEPEPNGGGRSKAVMLLIVAVLLLIVLVRVATSGSEPTATSNAGEPVATTITSIRNDAVADYDAALKTGKPVYVLFHSLTCEPCIEISAVVDKVMADYEGRVVYVNAITDDASAQQLASKFSFQYIPTSFFIATDGEVVGSYTGPLTEEDMRARLDELAGQ